MLTETWNDYKEGAAVERGPSGNCAHEASAGPQVHGGRQLVHYLANPGGKERHQKRLERQILTIVEWKRLVRNGEIQSALRLNLLTGLATTAALELKLAGSDKGTW